jgi:hypothetical protein
MLTEKEAAFLAELEAREEQCINEKIESGEAIRGPWWSSAPRSLWMPRTKVR